MSNQPGGLKPLTVAQLKAEARLRGIRGYSKLNRAELRRLLGHPAEDVGQVYYGTDILRNEARAVGIPNYEYLNRDELIAALSANQDLANGYNGDSKTIAELKELARQLDLRVNGLNKKQLIEAIRASGYLSNGYDHADIWELRDQARQLGIQGYSKMDKAALLQALAAPRYTRDVSHSQIYDLRDEARRLGVRNYSKRDQADLLQAVSRPPANGLKTCGHRVTPANGHTCGCGGKPKTASRPSSPIGSRDTYQRSASPRTLSNGYTRAQVPASPRQGTIYSGQYRSPARQWNGDSLYDYTGLPYRI